MNEFTQKAPAQAAVSPSKLKDPGKVPWYKKELILGLSAPWLALALVVFAAAGWYLFAPESKPDVNQLAFGNESGFKPVAPRFNQPPQQARQVPMGMGAEPVPEPEPESEQVMVQLSKNVTAQVQGVQEHSDANRVAIERLAETVKRELNAIEALQRQVKDLELKVMLASSRPAQPVERIASMPIPTPPKRSSSQAAVSSTALDGMHLSTIQNGMAWILWQEKTWAVQIGERLGSVVITGIDASSRKVYTSGGTLQ